MSTQSVARFARTRVDREPLWESNTVKPLPRNEQKHTNNSIKAERPFRMILQDCTCQEPPSGNAFFDCTMQCQVFLRKDLKKHQLFLTPSIKQFVSFVLKSFEPTSSCPSEFARGGGAHSRVDDRSYHGVGVWCRHGVRKHWRRKRGPQRYCLARLWEAPAPPTTVLVGRLRGLPQNAGVLLPCVAKERICLGFVCET